MTRLYFIRHATCDPVGVAIAGRAPGIALNAEGRRQAERLAEYLAATSFDAIYTSPIERARETAEAIAARRGLTVHALDALNEIDFGAWTGRAWCDLEADEHWRRFNVFRSGTRPPGGELAIETQLRIVSVTERLRAGHRDGNVALVSHGDVIRAALAYYLGIPLDLMQRLELSPASVSVLHLDHWGARLVRHNDTAAPP